MENEPTDNLQQQTTSVDVDSRQITELVADPWQFSQYLTKKWLSKIDVGTDE